MGSNVFMQYHWTGSTGADLGFSRNWSRKGRQWENS